MDTTVISVLAVASLLLAALPAALTIFNLKVFLPAPEQGRAVEEPEVGARSGYPALEPEACTAPGGLGCSTPAWTARRMSHRQRRKRCQTKSVIAVSTTTAPITRPSSSGCMNGPPAHPQSGRQATITAALARHRLGP